MKMLTATLTSGLPISIALEGKAISVVAEIFEESDKIRSFKIHSDNYSYHHPHEFGLENLTKCHGPKEKIKFWHKDCA